MIDKVSATYARIAGSTAKIAASLKSGADALMKAVDKIDKSPTLARIGPALARMASSRSASVAPVAGPDFAQAAEVGAVGGVAGGAAKIVAQEAAAFGISRAMGSAAVSASSVAASSTATATAMAATAVPAAATATAMAATAVPAAATTAAVTGTATVLGTVLTVLGTVTGVLVAVAAAAAAVYAIWKLAEAIWPVIKDDVAAVWASLSTVWGWAKKLFDVFVAVVSTAAKLLVTIMKFSNPIAIARTAFKAVGAAVGWAKDKAVEMAAAVRGVLLSAVSAVGKKWDQLKGVVSATAARVAGLASSAAGMVSSVGGAIKSGFSAALGLVSAALEKIAYAGVAIAGVGAAIVGPLTAAAKQFGEAGVAAGDLAEKTGLSAKQFTELSYAASRAGLSSGEFASGFSKASDSLQDAFENGGDAEKKFTQLGLSLDDLRLASQSDRFTILAGAVANIADPLERAKAAQDLFGSSGDKIAVMAERGAGGLQRMRAEASALGLVMDGPAVASAKALMDAYQLVKDALQGLWQTLGAAVAPQLTATAQRTAEVVKAAVAWAKANQPLVAQIFRVATVASIAGTAIAAVASAIVPAIPIVAGLAVALVAGGAAWLKYGGSAMQIVGNVTQSLQAIYAEATKVVGGIGDAIKGGNLELAVQIAWLGVQTAWTKGLMALATLTSTGVGGVLSALAAGDWAGAGAAAWDQIKIVFTEGISGLEQLWSTLKSVTDEVVTYVQQAWNTALRSIAGQIDALLGATSKVLATLATYDPTDAAAKAGEAINKLGSIKAKGPSASANADLEAGFKERQLARDADASAKKETRDSELEDLRKKAEVQAAGSGFQANEKVAQLQAQLDKALAAAAAARKKAEIPDPGLIERKGEIDRAAKSAGGGGGLGATFSAAALVAMGGRGSPQERMVKAQEAGLVKADKQIEALGRLEKAMTVEFVA